MIFPPTDARLRFIPTRVSAAFLISSLTFICSFLLLYSSLVIGLNIGGTTNNSLYLFLFFRAGTALLLSVGIVCLLNASKVPLFLIAFRSDSVSSSPSSHVVLGLYLLFPALSSCNSSYIFGSIYHGVLPFGEAIFLFYYIQRFLKICHRKI